ncbi:NUDIX domain-containing protein [Kitasatospora sp. CM 4170]|uniref:NUDIX domain-containing protein n=1 Tax=Kitasatospora aburaviensis TaxID=67265 RepID=A0ABW1EZD9_9ACTN|nr:NUDIX domain-containing protein [Kitasatospora sp. CM 4170]WNM48974.1 NUDIX domain-containing protein [Kitasatospora sp. CM 4170]
MVTSSAADAQDGRAGRELMAAAGVLFPDGQGRVLVVRLPYDRKHPVAIPGGGWEPEDLSPRRTAVREIAEELGFTPRLGPLACIDWTLDDLRPPIAAHLYWAEPLTPEQSAAFTPDAAEVGGWAWLTPEQAGHALPPRLSRRVGACLRAPRSAGPLELEDSLPAGHTLDHLAAEPPVDYTGLAGVALTGGADRPTAGAAAPPLDRATYIATRPRIRAKARTLFTAADGRVLLVRLRPWDGPGGEEPYWVLPGGGIEADRELPRAAARREVREELGWECEPGRLLALDWLPGREADPASRRDTAVLVYVFDGGTVTEEQLASAVLAEDELVELRLCDQEEARSLLSAGSWARTAAALAARHRPGGPAELVGGRPAD